MIVAVLPAPGVTRATWARTGQGARLDAHLAAYARAGHTADVVSLPDGVRRAILRPLAQARWRTFDVCRALNLLGAIPAVTARLAYGVPFIVSHGADYEAIARVHRRLPKHVRKWTWLRRVVFRFAAAVFVSNAELAARFARAFPRTRILHRPNWVDVERFRPTDAASVPGRVLYVGRLVEEKNLLTLEEAVSGIFGAHLRCVGEGPLRLALQRRGADCPGAIPWERLPDEYRAARVFALPSWTEGHPKALTEAMACGVPCVVSDRVTGCVTDDETGLVHDVEDVTHLRKQLARVLDERALAARLGQAARAHAVRYWDARVLLPQEIADVEAAARGDAA